MIASGLTYPTFNQLVKQLFLEVAEEDFALPFKRQTDSRLALVTGISRKEISQLRRRRRGAADMPEVEESVVTHVIGRWMAGPPYATPDGIPRRLRYESADPSARELRAPGARARRSTSRCAPCSTSCCTSAAPRCCPTATSSCAARCTSRPPTRRASWSCSAPIPAELFSTIMHNIEHGEPPWLQRKVVYDNIGADALPALREEARHAGLDFVRRANALLASYDRDRHPDAPGRRGARASWSASTTSRSRSSRRSRLTTAATDAPRPRRRPGASGGSR